MSEETEHTADTGSVRFCQHLDEFSRFLNTFQEHHERAKEMNTKLDAMNMSVTQLVHNTEHLHYLGTIAEQIGTIKADVLDAALNRSRSGQTPTRIVGLIMAYMFAVLFIVGTGFFVLYAAKENMLMTLDTVRGQVSIDGRAVPPQSGVK